MLSLFYFILFWLCWVLVVAHRLCDLHCSVWGLQLQHVRSSSLNRDRTWDPSTGSGESSLSHWATWEVTRWHLYYPAQATSGCDRKWSHNLRGILSFTHATCPEHVIWVHCSVALTSCRNPGWQSSCEWAEYDRENMTEYIPVIRNFHAEGIRVISTYIPLTCSSYMTMPKYKRTGECLKREKEKASQVALV